MPRGVELAVLAAANLLALAAFCWPLLAAALPEDAAAALPYAALAIAPLAAVAIVVSMDGSVRSAHTVALLGVLAAVGSAVRVASTGVGGVEAVFILLILAGRAFGARFGMLLGAATIAVSSACGVASGRGRRSRSSPARGWAPGPACSPGGCGARPNCGCWPATASLASYLFGLLTNLWFWPFAVGAGTGISYVPGAPLGTNLSSFLLYSLLTSTAGWDTLRAVTTDHRHRRGGAGHPRRTPAGEAGLQHGFWTRRAVRAGPTRPCREPAAPQGLRSIRSAISGLVPRAWLMVGWSFFLPRAAPVGTGHSCGRVFTGICRAGSPRFRKSAAASRIALSAGPVEGIGFQIELSVSATAEVKARDLFQFEVPRCKAVRHCLDGERRSAQVA